MKSRFTVTLLVLNAAALAAGAFYLTRLTTLREAAAEAASAQAEQTAWKTAAEAAAERGEQAPRIIYRTNAFQWSQLESTDYRQYIANLRGIGCPESTIKDIILTDVMRLYAQRRGQYYQNGRPFKFWETDEKRELKEAQREEREKALASIDKELPAVLRELLGINYEREVNKYFVDANEDRQRLAFLSDQKRDAALALREKFEGDIERAQWTNADEATLQGIEREHETELGQLLTADEKEEYDLSMSPTADRLRQELVGFNPTEEEFKELFAQEEAVDAKYAFADAGDTNAAAEKAADEQAALAAFRNGLTADRAAQLTESENPEYQTLCELSERFDLPDKTSDAMLDMEKVAERERMELLANKDIAPDRLSQALQAIQAETEKTARLTLGEQAYAQYATTATWLKELGKN